MSDYTAREILECLENGKLPKLKTDKDNKNDIRYLEKLRDEINEKIKDYYNKQENEEIISNNKYVGKTYVKQYPDGEIKYYKILAIDPTNEYRMYTLVFGKPKFNSGYAIKIKDKLYPCYTESSLLEIENIGWFCNDIKFDKLDFNGDNISKIIDSYTEITKEEYDEAFDRFIKELHELKNNYVL